MDLREEFLNKVGNNLIRNFAPEDVNKIMNVVMIGLEDYELSERTTEVGFCDNSSQKLLELYAGAILTEGKSRRTVYGYVYLLRRFLEDVGKDFVEVTTMDVRIWLAKMQQDVSMRTCENYRSYLSAFYSWLCLEGFMESNPMLKIKPIKYIDKERIPFTDTQIDLLRSSCDSVRNRAIFELLICSGLRVGELCALNINDVDFNTRKILVRESKGGKQRFVYVTDVCLMYLDRYLKSRDDNLEYLFITRNNTRMSKDCVRDILKKLERISGVENVHPHRCRRTFATNMYKKGMDIHTIQKLMGHANINTTTVYIAENEEMVEYEYKKCA